MVPLRESAERKALPAFPSTNIRRISGLKTGDLDSYLIAVDAAGEKWTAQAPLDAILDETEQKSATSRPVFGPVDAEPEPHRSLFVASNLNS
jgi:hypothetical protein